MTKKNKESSKKPKNKKKDGKQPDGQRNEHGYEPASDSDCY